MHNYDPDNQLCLLKLIDLYRRHPVLWDLKHKQNKSRQARRATYKILLEQYNSQMEEKVTLEYLKKQIANLKNTHQKEYRKWAQNRANGLPYEPKLWHFYPMLYLYNEYDPDKAKMAVENVKEKIKRKLDAKLAASENQAQAKRIKDEATADDNGVIEIEDDTSNTQCDETSSEDAFAVSISQHLLKLEPMQRAIAQKLIAEVIANAKQGSLGLLATLEL